MCMCVLRPQPCKPCPAHAHGVTWRPVGIHRCPAAAAREGFDPLWFQSGPIHPSLGNLVLPTPRGSLRRGHSALQPRTPGPRTLLCVWMVSVGKTVLD